MHFHAFGSSGEQPRGTVPTPGSDGRLALLVAAGPSAPAAPTRTGPGGGSRPCSSRARMRPLRAVTHLPACSPHHSGTSRPASTRPHLPEAPGNHPKANRPEPKPGQSWLRGTRLETASHLFCRSSPRPPACSPSPTSFRGGGLPPPCPLYTPASEREKQGVTRAPGGSVPRRRALGVGRGLPWSLAW